jgi:hypothetical protein
LFACGALACGEVVFDPEPINGGAGSGQAGRAGSGGSSAVNNGGSSGVSNGGSAGVSNGGAAGSNNTGGGGSGNGGNGNGTGGTSTSGTGGTDDPGDAGEIFSDGGTLDAGASDATPPGPVNLISNPDFESGFAPWTAAFGGTMGATIDQAHTGAQSGRVTQRTQAYQGAHYNLTGLVTPGKTYAVTAFGRLDGSAAPSPAPSATMALTAKITCLGVAPQYRTIKTLTGNDSSWTELNGPLVVPSVPSGAPTSTSCTVTELLMYLEGPPAGFTIYIDDVSVIEQ